MRIKVLPPNPSLAHLKQQAKDMLASMRESDSTATLAQAQRALANEYDFRTWAELKAEVERLTVDADQSDAALGAAIADAFGLGRLTAPATVISHDFQGPSLRLKTSGGDWMAHEVFDWVDHAHVESTIPLIDAARKASIRVPTPVPTAAGHWVARVDGRSWRVDEWFDRGPALPSPTPLAALRAVGELMATIHDMALPAAGDVNPWLTQRRTPQQWEAILKTVQETGAKWATKLEAALPAINAITEVAAGPPPPPLILSHSNLVGETLRAGPDDSIAVVEWDFAGPNVPSWEFGGALGWAAGDGDVARKRVRSLFDGYASTGRPIALDIDMFASAISASLNNLISHIAQALDGTDPATQPRRTKEVAHMLAHVPTAERFKRILDACGGG